MRKSLHRKHEALWRSGFHVTTTPEALHLRLERTAPHTAFSIARGLSFGMLFLSVVTATLAWGIQSAAPGYITPQMSLFPVLAFFIGVFGAVVLPGVIYLVWWLVRLLWPDREKGPFVHRIQFTQHALIVDGRRVPLEAITSVVDPHDGNTVELHAEGQSIEVISWCTPAQARALTAEIRAHVLKRRMALQAEGHDLRAPPVPAALRDLQRNV